MKSLKEQLTNEGYLDAVAAADKLSEEFKKVIVKAASRGGMDRKTIALAMIVAFNNSFGRGSTLADFADKLDLEVLGRHSLGIE